MMLKKLIQLLQIQIIITELQFCMTALMKTVTVADLRILPSVWLDR